MMKCRLLFAFLAATLIVPAYAGDKNPNLTPGTYKSWGQDIDQIEIVKPFKAANYDTIVVEKFDTSKTPTPEEKEKAYPSVKSALSSYSDTLVEALRDELKSKAAVEQASGASKTAKTLIIRGTVEEMSPGSRAGRMMVGYGAGSTATQVTGEIVDAKSGAVLVRFTQKRRSGGTFKFGGGSDVVVMRDAIHAMGKDIAHIIDAFH